MEHFEGLLIASMAAYEVPGACISRCRSILAAAWKAAQCPVCRGKRVRPGIGPEESVVLCECSRIAPDASAVSSGAIGAEKEPDAPGDGLDGFLGPSGALPPS